MLVDQSSDRFGTATDRRAFLQFSSLGFGRLLLSQWGNPLSLSGCTKVIDCWLAGGPSHLDTYDLKPGAPADVRGPFRPIPTNVPGIAVCELLPAHQRIADKLVLIRSLYHDQVTHEAAVPCFEIAPPSRLALPGVYQFSPRDRNRIVGKPTPAPVHGGEAVRFCPPHGVTPAPAGPGMREAFDLSREPVRARDRYGDTVWGRSLLTARRLVEVGVPYVRVELGAAGSDWWDDHFALEANLRRRLPMFDRAFAALVEDLHDRGLGREVLVVAWGEFGRTPRIDRFAGRGHWPRAMTAVLSGGGLAGGRVVGATTADGGEVKDQPVNPVELITEIRRAAGLITSADPLERRDRGPSHW